MIEIIRRILGEILGIGDLVWKDDFCFFVFLP